MRLPKYEELPAWFRDGVEHRRENIGEDAAEGAAWGRTFVLGTHALMSVDESTWLFTGRSSKRLLDDDIRDPLYELRPGLPFLHEPWDHDKPRLVMGLGNCVFVQACFYELVVGVYGPGLAWFGSAPRDMVVVKRDGQTVAAVCSYCPNDYADRDPWDILARAEREKRTMQRSMRQ